MGIGYSKTIIYSVTIAGVILFSAVCWHSVEEIHYLKSFFPRQFSVQDAYYAAGVELIKVVIIGMPIGMIIFVCLYFLRHGNMDKK